MQLATPGRSFAPARPLPTSARQGQWLSGKPHKFPGKDWARGRCAGADPIWTGWHAHALTKILTHDEPPGYRRTAPRPKPKLDPFRPVLHQILEDDKKAPKKQPHTARRIFDFATSTVTRAA